jgi:hypothetical protein
LRIAHRRNRGCCPLALTLVTGDLRHKRHFGVIVAWRHDIRIQHLSEARNGTSSTSGVATRSEASRRAHAQRDRACRVPHSERKPQLVTECLSEHASDGGCLKSFRPGHPNNPSFNADGKHQRRNAEPVPPQATALGAPSTFPPDGVTLASRENSSSLNCREITDV